ncbi:MAG: GHKL domain-containing protein, partial [Candidatus Lindowbacteria bacterium]|nr:GHKL domain-containing protein [Candidatus Lindowbacteria bacterium]
YINMNVYLEFVLYNVVGWVVGELVTRRIQDQKKLEESKRLAALGEVAAGIAHEIRNPAQTIRGAIDFVLKKSKEESVTGILRTAREEVDRLDSFAKNFLSLASNPVPRKVSTNISALCRDIGARVTLAKGENIPEITYDELENLPEVQCDPEQIGQVIRNLMENAVEAIAKTDRIKISGILLTNTVVISVEDSGAGVPKDLQEKIFEPFCSKKSGGTGLGLAISRRIMEAHQGGIICEKSSLNGAAFHLTLPRQT